MLTEVNESGATPSGSSLLDEIVVFKLVASAQQRWRAVHAPHLDAPARVGARFECGPLVEPPKAVAA